MSFGFGVGDFIAVLKLAKEVRRGFAGAPEQFSAVSNEVRSLSIVLEDADVAASELDLTSTQRKKLDEILRGCNNVLEDIKKIQDESLELGSTGGSLNVRAKRQWKRLTWKAEDIVELRDRLTSNVTLLDTFRNRLNSTTTIDIKKGVDELKQRGDEHDRLEMLSWLTPLDYSAQQTDTFRTRSEGTCQWLIDTQKYQAWLQTKGGVLFCDGIPGAGKTVMASVVIHDIAERFQDDADVGFAFIYFNFRRQDDQTTENMLSSLMKQLAWGLCSLPDEIRNLFRQHKPKGVTRPSLTEILNCLEAVVGMYERVYVVVDALDEYQSTDNSRDDFLSALLALLQSKGINIFATSRPIPEITNLFIDFPSIRIAATNEDVQRYLKGNLARLPAFVRKSKDLQADITAKIVEAVGGMFLLAHLYLDSLRGKRSPKAVREALGKITKGSNTYDGAYDDAMERIQHQLPDQEDLAMQALAWITHAKAPLTTGELRHALAIESGQTELDEENLSEIEDIVSACVGLVTIDVKSDVIRLVHYTTQDYFERNRSRWFSTAEEDITGHCMTYLSFTTFDSGPCKDDGGFEERLEVYRLYTYSAKHWASHASKVNPTGGEPIAFTMSNAQVQAASQAMLVQKKSFVQSYSQKFDVLPTRLHFAAFFGLSSLVRRFLPRQEHQAGTKRLAGLTLEHVDEVDSRDVLGMTPLNLAASKGFTDVVVLLLDHGANVDTAANDAWTPLCGAIYKGNQEMVDLLLRAGACVNPKIPTIWSPLCLAVRGGHEDMVGQLLESGAYREATDSEVSSLLCIAASKGVTKVVRQLLQQGANFERSARPDKRTPLSWAAANGHDNVATTLILYGASLHVKDKLGYRPMGLAAFHGHQGMVARFLRHGVNVDQRNRAGSTALHLAATRGHIGVVKLLLDQGANIDFQDKEGYTALHRAAKADSNPAVMLLLLKRASVEVQDAAGRTPLSWAAGNGCKHVIKLLLIRRAAVGVKDATGRTALSWAAGNGRDNVIKLLLEHGVDANEADQNGQTPLGWAVAHGHADAAALLLLHNGSTSVDMRDSKGRTPLLWAAWKDHADIADLLLDHGAELEACDSHGRTPLSWAVGAVAAVTLLRLLARGADVESCDERGQTPLMWAVKGGKDGLAGTIRRQMASGDISNPPLTAEVETTSRLDGGNSAATSLQPPMPASRHHRSDTPHERPGPRNRSFVVIHADRRTFTPVVHNYTDIARCLLDKGAALEARDHAGQTALSIAAANNNNTAVELLLSRGARLDTRDTKGHSPLAYATAAGHEAMVRLLLDRGARTEVE